MTSSTRQWIPAVLLIVSAVLFSASFALIHQGEELYTAGAVTMWLARLGVALSIIAAILCPFRARVAMIAAMVAAIAIMPLSFLSVFPNSWCALLPCGDEPTKIIFLPGGAVPLLFTIVAIALLWRSGQT